MRLLLIFIVLAISTANCESKKEPFFSDIDPLTIQEGSIDSLIKQLSHPDRLKRKYACDGIRIYMKLDRGPNPIQAFYPIKKQLLVETDEIIQYKLMYLYMYFPDSLYKNDDRQLFLNIAADTTRYQKLRSQAFQALARLEDDRAIDLAMNIITEARSQHELLQPYGILGSAISYVGHREYALAIPEIKKTLIMLIVNRSRLSDALGYGMFPTYLHQFAGYYSDIAVPFLDSLLKSDNDTVCYYAAIELGFMKKEYAVPVLIEALQNPLFNIRSERSSKKITVINALLELDTIDAIPSLKKSLNDKTEINGKLVVADAAADALRHFGYKIKETESEPVQYIIEYEPPEYKDLK